MKPRTPRATAYGIQLAAGGLVWRRGPTGQDEIALVHRTKYGDWALPKGKPEEGETLEQTALREAQEETGCQLALGEFLGSYAYMAGTPKVVLLWHMRFLAPGYAAAAGLPEITQVDWLPPAEALRRLTHPSEKDFVARFGSPPLPPGKTIHP